MQSSISEGRANDRRGYYRSPVTLADYHRGKEPANKGRKFPPEPLSPREVLALLEQCGSGSCGKRDRALIVLMWRTGLRVGEVLALYPKDIDLDAGRVAVLHGKGDRARVVGLDPMACSIVREWMAERRWLGLKGTSPVFCVVSRPTIGKPMHSAYVRNKLKELGARAGIEKRVHPHGLRHTHAFELAGEKVDLRLVRRQLGHSNLAITARYVEHLNPFEVVDAIRARPWPGAAPGTSAHSAEPPPAAA
jgi:integrase